MPTQVPRAGAKQLSLVIQKIPCRSLQDFHQIAANAKPYFSKALQFITGQPPKKSSAQIAVRHHFVSFSLRLPTKMFMQVVETRMQTKMKKRVSPLFLVTDVLPQA